MISSQSICSYPFNHVAVDSSGHYRLCCEAKATHLSIHDLTINEWFGSDYLNGVRNSMKRGEKIEECSNCYFMESRGLTSKRLKNRAGLNIKNYEASPAIRSLDVRISNTCNAKCPTCGPNDSSSWIRDYNKMIDFGILESHCKKISIETKAFPADSFFLDLKEWDIVRSYIAGGEPMIMDELLPFLDHLKSSCNVIINTNLSTLNKELIEKLNKFDQVDIIASCDGINQGFEFMRYPVKYSTFTSNLEKILHRLNKVKIFFNFTLSVFNLTELKNVLCLFINYSQQSHSFERLEINFVNQPSYLVVHALSSEYRKKALKTLKDFVKENETTLSELNLLDRVVTIIRDVETRERVPKETLKYTRSYAKWLYTNRSPSSQFLVENDVLNDLDIEL